MIEPDKAIGGLVEDKWWERVHYVEEMEEGYKEYRRVWGENLNLRLTNDTLLTKYKNLVTALENLLHYSEEMRSWHKSEFLGEKGARGFYELGSSESYNDVVSKVEQILQNVVGIDGEDT